MPQILISALSVYKNVNAFILGGGGRERGQVGFQGGPGTFGPTYDLDSKRHVSGSTDKS